jgi:hypothetical protein
MNLPRLRSRVQLLSAALALLLLAAGTLAQGAVAKGKADRAIPTGASQLRGVNLRRIGAGDAAAARAKVAAAKRRR